MKYFNIPGTDIKPSVITLGTAPYGGSTNKETAFALLDRYVELGGNVIDTARVYGGPGHLSELTVGQWLESRKMSGKVYISTKGAHPRFSTMDKSRLAPEEIIHDFEESLACLGVKHIDIYWLHRDDERLPVSGIVDTLDSLVKSGRAGCVGVSNWRAKRIEEANAYARENGKTQISASQIMYSAAGPIRAAVDSTLVLMDKTEYGWYAGHDFPVFAYSSQAKGYFTKLDEGRLSGSAQRIYDTPANREIYEKLKAEGERTGRSVSHMALRTLVEKPDFPTSAIVGCSSVAQLEDSVRAVD